MTTPKTWAVGEIVTDVMMNAEVRDRVKVKEMFVPATVSVLATGVSQPLISLLYHPVAGCYALNQFGVVAFRAPYDFLSIVEAKLVVIAAATQAAANWDLYTSYGGIGELANTHSASDVATTYNVTVNKIYELDISALLASLAAEDYVGVELLESTSGHDVAVLGVRLKYNVT